MTRIASTGPNVPGYRMSAILDARGNPYRKPIDPLDGVSKPNGGVLKDLPTSPLELAWSVDAVRGALTEHVLGMFFRSSILIDAMQGNDRIQAAMGARTGALLGLPEIYEAADGDSTNEVRDAWKAAWPLCHAPPGQGETLEEITRIRLMAGLQVSELVWDTENDSGLWQPYLKPWSLQNLYIDQWRRSLVALTEDGPVDVVPGDGRWFVTAPNGVYRSHISGLVRALSLPWLLHNFARRDWARYSERHGTPIILAKVPAMADAVDKKRFESDLLTLGSEAVAVLPQGIDGEYFDLDLLEATANTWQGFDNMLLRAENAITIAIQWQNLTTEVKEGSEAAARVHGDVKQTAIVLDDRVMADDVYQQIARPFALFNFGDASLAPRVHRDTAVLEDKVQELAALNSFALAVQAIATAGVEVDVVALARAYRVRGMDTAKKIAAAVVAGTAPADAVKEAA